jgi:ribonuclease HII
MGRDLASFDEGIRRLGFPRLCGVDEVGRGPLAGPVVAAAVVFAGGTAVPPGLDDSKLLSAARRGELEPLILEAAAASAVAAVEPDEIEQLNILRASLLAMERAVALLGGPPDFILVDGSHGLGLGIPQKTVVKGDRRSASIAAASILAKEHRDRLMRGYAAEYPAYGFDLHMGYATAEHREAIRLHGPCPIHRRSFRGVREYLTGDGPRQGSLL